MDNNENNFNQNEQNSTGAEKTAPWFLKKDCIVIEKDYNPYRENISVLSEVYDENKQHLNGPTPLSHETPFAYQYRMAVECSILKGGVANRLRKDSRFVAFILFTALMMMQFLATAFAELSLAVSPEIFNILSYVYLVLQYALLFPPVFYIATLGNKNKVRTYFKKPQVSVFYVARWSVIALGGVYVVSIISNILFSLIQSYGVNVNDVSSPLPAAPLELVLYFLCVVVCAPIFEEILFRGILLTRLMKYGGWFAAVVTAILFGAYHQNHEQFFFAAAIGIIFAIVDIRAGSIIPSIIAHTLVNGYSFLSVFVLSFTNYQMTVIDPSVKLTGPFWAIWATTVLDMLIYVFMIVAIITFIIELVKNKKELELPDPKCGLSAGEKATVFFFSPAMIGFLAVIALFIALNSFIDLEAILSSIQ